jgi:(S)-mandelate dehydrogenase
MEDALMKRRYYAGGNFRRAMDIDELRSLAGRRAPRLAFEYLDGGAEDEATLRRNREIFEQFHFSPRTLVHVSSRSQAVELFGQQIQSPFLIAPTGFNGMLRHNGDLSLAAAAKQAGVPFCLSTVSTNRIEDIGQQAGGKLWFQLYPLRDRNAVRSLMERAAAAGFQALILTTDAPAYGNREWDQRNYVALGRPSMRAKFDVVAHPRWLFDVMIPNGAPRLVNLTQFLPAGKDSAVNGARYMSTQLNEDLDWEYVRWLRELWPHPLIIKGILSVRDAEIAAAEGVDGIILSNHGGRQLDGAISPMEIVHEISQRVGQRVTVMIDSGFRRGSDIVKALALGAKAVLIGRAALYGLAAGGQEGVQHALNILRAEIDRVLALIGCHSCAELSPDYLLNTKPAVKTQIESMG